MSDKQLENDINIFDESDKEYTRYLDTMTTKSLKDFSLKAITTYGTIDKLREANKLISVIRSLYTKRKIIGDTFNPYFIELMETAAFIHNLFTDGSWISVFKAREILSDIAKEADIKDEHIEHIFTIVEGQLGEDMPVAGVRPNPNSPVSDFALCCWITKDLIKDV